MLLPTKPSFRFVMLNIVNLIDIGSLLYMLEKEYLEWSVPFHRAAGGGVLSLKKEKKEC